MIELMKYWENVNSEQEEGKFIIEIMKLEFCECTYALVCAKNKVIKYCKIHKNAESYKKISSEIKHTPVLNTPSNQSRQKKAWNL